MSRLNLQAEITKLARLLGVVERELDYLQPLGHEALRALRERGTAAVYDDARPMLQRVAAASKLLPVPVIARVGEKIFGALLCARVAGLMPPERALEVALKLPDAFLAEVAVQLDPRSAHEVIGRMPAARVAAVAALLVQQRDWITMGRFVDFLSRDTIKAVIEGLDDDAALLHVAFYVENRARLNDIAGLLAEQRLRRLVALATAQGSGLWAEALSLMSQLEPTVCRRLGDMASEQDESTLLQMLRTAQDQGLWDAMLPVIACMSEAGRERLLRLPALADPEVLSSVIAACDREQLWDRFLPLVGQMAEPMRRAAAQAVERLPVDTLQRLFDAVQRAGLWADLVGLLPLIDADERRNIARLMLQQPEVLLEQLLKATHARRLWPQLLPLMTAMTEPELGRLNRLAQHLKLDWPL